MPAFLLQEGGVKECGHSDALVGWLWTSFAQGLWGGREKVQVFLLVILSFSFISFLYISCLFILSLFSPFFSLSFSPFEKEKKKNPKKKSFNKSPRKYINSS